VASSLSRGNAYSKDSLKLHSIARCSEVVPGGLAGSDGEVPPNPAAQDSWREQSRSRDDVHKLLGHFLANFFGEIPLAFTGVL
jgi:hypothetical protein